MGNTPGGALVELVDSILTTTAQRTAVLPLLALSVVAVVVHAVICNDVVFSVQLHMYTPVLLPTTLHTYVTHLHYNLRYTPTLDTYISHLCYTPTLHTYATHLRYACYIPTLHTYVTYHLLYKPTAISHLVHNTLITFDDRLLTYTRGRCRHTSLKLVADGGESDVTNVGLAAVVVRIRDQTTGGREVVVVGAPVTTNNFVRRHRA